MNLWIPLYLRSWLSGGIDIPRKSQRRPLTGPRKTLLEFRRDCGLYLKSRQVVDIVELQITIWFWLFPMISLSQISAGTLEYLFNIDLDHKEGLTSGGSSVLSQLMGWLIHCRIDIRRDLEIDIRRKSRRMSLSNFITYDLGFQKNFCNFSFVLGNGLAHLWED